MNENRYTYVDIYIANKCTKFYAKRLSPSENVDETRRGSTFFDSPCRSVIIKLQQNVKYVQHFCNFHYLTKHCLLQRYVQ